MAKSAKKQQHGVTVASPYQAQLMPDALERPDPRVSMGNNFPNGKLPTTTASILGRQPDSVCVLRRDLVATNMARASAANAFAGSVTAGAEKVLPETKLD